MGSENEMTEGFDLAAVLADPAELLSWVGRLADRNPANADVAALANTVESLCGLVAQLREEAERAVDALEDADDRAEMLEDAIELALPTVGDAKVAQMLSNVLEAGA